MAEAKGGVQGAPATHRERESDPAHQGYAGVALGVMAAITRNERATMILNVRNGTTLAGLPADAVVEVPTMVDANGVHPLTTTQPSLDQLGLMQQVKAVERHTIAAARRPARRTRRCWPSPCIRWSTRSPWPGTCWPATSTASPRSRRCFRR